MYLFFKNINQNQVHIYSCDQLLKNSYSFFNKDNIEKYVFNSLNMKSVVVLAKEFDEKKIEKALSQNKGIYKCKEFVLIRPTQKNSFKNELNYLI